MSWVRCLGSVEWGLLPSFPLKFLLWSELLMLFGHRCASVEVWRAWQRCVRGRGQVVMICLLDTFLGFFSVLLWAEVADMACLVRVVTEMHLDNSTSVSWFLSVSILEHFFVFKRAQLSAFSCVITPASDRHLLRSRDPKQSFRVDNTKHGVFLCRNQTTWKKIPGIHQRWQEQMCGFTLGSCI